MPGFLRMVFLIVLLGGVLSLPGNAAAQAQQPAGEISESLYWQLVQETQEAVQSLRGLPVHEGHARLVAYHSSWRSIQWVVMENGERLHLDMFYLSEMLAAPEPDLERLTTELEHLLTYRDLPQQAATAKKLSDLQRILNRPDFQWKDAQPDPLQQLLERLVNQFLAFLARLLENDTLGIGVSIMRFVLLAAGVALVIFAVTFGVRTLLRSMVAEASAAADELAEPGLTAHVALDRANSLSETGDYRSAVRYLYLSTLLLLEERSLLRYDRSKTNREYLRSINHLPQLAAILREIVDVFDRVWYGFHTLEEQEYARYAERVEELRRHK